MGREEAEQLVEAFAMLARKEAELLFGNVGGIKQQVLEQTIVNAREMIVDILCGDDDQDVDDA